jgi:hypothetical protein
MESEHYEWLAVGATMEEAMAGLREVWDSHMKPLKREGALTWAEWVKERGESPADYYGANVRRCALGKGYRDGDGEDER